jgi:hypothetical protein
MSKTDDPVFAAIEAHRSAYAAYVAAYLEARAMPRKKAEANLTATAKASIAFELAATAPQTLEGAQAMMSYLKQVAFAISAIPSDFINPSSARCSPRLCCNQQRRLGTDDEISNGLPLMAGWAFCYLKMLNKRSSALLTAHPLSGGAFAGG